MSDKPLFFLPKFPRIGRLCNHQLEVWIEDRKEFQNFDVGFVYYDCWHWCLKLWYISIIIGPALGKYWEEE